MVLVDVNGGLLHRQRSMLSKDAKVDIILLSDVAPLTTFVMVERGHPNTSFLLTHVSLPTSIFPFFSMSLL